MPNLSKHGRERSKYYNKGFEHDDRTMVPHESTRRVSFKNHGRRNKHNRQRGWDSKIRALLQDDDVEMNSNSRSSERYNNGNISRNQRRGFHQRLDRPGARRFLTESPSFWYKVTIRYGGRYEKDYLLKLLGNYIKPVPFIPIGYKVSSNDATFTIEDHAAAEELLNADKRITVNDGFKINIQVRSFNPLVEIGTKITEIMTKVMSSRYNPYTKALDLSKFHLDPNFLSENVFCPLNKENVMLAVIGIIHESIPDLVALDLSNNKLSSLNCMKSMIEKVASLKILHIGQNKIRDIKQLDALKGLNLEELVVDGNSMCDKFTSKDEYIR
uniref:Putative mrna export factor tap/mex67 n=1 Tax=Panstrongylus lignarius TaxID=156445 RepID=A0A224XT94_9HEMI